jgi:shikimate dehydrogenase
MISGSTGLIAHIGYPTETFKSPLIYNPHFERTGVDAVVMPMGCHADNFPALLRSLFKLTNLRGAIITMPLKVAVVALLDELSPAVRVSGSCNAVRRMADGRLQGDMFDGEGFVRGLRRKGMRVEGARAFVAGCGGVGAAIAASLAGAGVAALSLYDARREAAQSLSARIAQFRPALRLSVGSGDPAGHDLVVNATPLGMSDGDPMPMEVARIDEGAFVGEVVMKQETTAFLKAAQARGCRYQVGTDMLFEQIPAYLEFFGFPPATPDELRAVARIRY